MGPELLASALESSNQNKGPDSSYGVHAGRPPSVLTLPAPAPFSSPSITVCLHYLGSWMNCGSGLSLGSCGGPTLPCLPSTPPPQTLCSLQPSPATSPPPHVVHSHKRSFSSNMGRIHARVYFFFFLFFKLLTPYLWQIARPLWLHHSNTETLSAVPQEDLKIGPVSSWRSAQAWWNRVH